MYASLSLFLTTDLIQDTDTVWISGFLAINILLQVNLCCLCHVLLVSSTLLPILVIYSANLSFDVCGTLLSCANFLYVGVFESFSL